ncbi:hypothetical protein BMS3Abin03_03085 [bacterium BMS3Abin03]|nr:hypothetical protein BMS3Abin03_03085 [bacterium BMS3Abin03]
MKILKLIILLFIPLIFSGCIKVDTKVKVNKDGSGTIEETVLMSSAVIEMMTQFMSSFQDSTGTPEKFSLFKEDELKDKASELGKNVKYISGEEIKKDEWEGYKAVYAFDDLNTIRMEPDPNEKVPTGTGGDGENKEEEYYTFKFIPGDVAEVIIDRPEIEKDIKTEEETAEEETESGEEGMNDQFINMMKGMKISIVIEFNGEIVESNATYVDGSEVTLLGIDFSELLNNKESLEKLKKHPPENLDDMKELIGNIPGMKLELKRSITIKFK